MKTKGNAENIYFALDENKNFIGMNHSAAQTIQVNFENNEVSKVIFINQLAGKMSPMGQTPKEEQSIKGFKWLEDQRPKSKYDLLSPKN
jgi:hypothetical protein